MQGADRVAVVAELGVVVVNGYRDGRQPGPGRGGGDAGYGPWVFEADPDQPLGGEGTQDQPEALGHPGADDDLAGGGVGGANAPQVGGENFAQPRVPGGVGVAEFAA